MSSKMQKHVERLYEAYGKAAEQDLRTLGFQCVADALQQAVAACGRAALLETLVSNACSLLLLAARLDVNTPRLLNTLRPNSLL